MTYASFHKDLSEYVMTMDILDSLQIPKIGKLHWILEGGKLLLPDCLKEKRYMPFEETNPRTPLPPNVLDDYENSKLSDVLEDIHQFRTDVTLADLNTSYLMMAFQKKDERKPDIKEQVKKVG